MFVLFFYNLFCVFFNKINKEKVFQRVTFLSRPYDSILTKSKLYKLDAVLIKKYNLNLTSFSGKRTLNLLLFVIIKHSKLSGCVDLPKHKNIKQIPVKLLFLV